MRWGGSHTRPFDFADHSGLERPELIMSAETAKPREPARGHVHALTDLDEPAMERLAVSLGEPPFRGRQLFGWVHDRLETELERMSNLPRDFGRRLGGRHLPATAEREDELVSADGTTRKRLLRLADGARVEAVLMSASASRRDSDRHTVCVSSQVGCALGCTFCVTGQVGFARQLSPGEIVEQVYHFERALCQESDAGPAGRDRRFVTNVVFMGMGEPLSNYESVMAAVRLLVSPKGFGLGARHITVSTAGLTPGIERLSRESLQLGLAISLHAADDELRSRLMPINRRFPLAGLLKAARGYAETTGRRVSYEYALMEGVNDGVAQARKLASLLSGQLCHVNLIPLNRSLDPSLKPSTPRQVASFKRALESEGVPCTLRQTKGEDILAACGQLRYTATHEC